MTFKISLGQMDVKLGDPAANLATVTRMTEEARRLGSDAVIFPELWSTGYDLTRAGQYASDLRSGLFADLSTLAARTGIHLLGSTLSLLGENKFGNTLTVFSPEGRLLADYSKTHLFRLMDEEKYLTAGDKPVLVDLPFGRAGLAICYDLRFPELFAAVAARTDLFVVVASWPVARVANWTALLTARAIETQAYVLGVNRVGSGGGLAYSGASRLVSPTGALLDGDVAADGAERVVAGEVDPADVASLRAKFPFLADRRPDVYRRIRGD